MGKWQGKGTTSHHLPPTGHIAPEPIGIDPVPTKLGEEDVMVDTVRRSAQVNGRYSNDFAVVGTSRHPLGASDQGVLRRMSGSVCIL